MKPLSITGTLRQSDADPLRQSLMAQIESGGFAILATGLKAIEFGALQVLLAAASDARKIGVPCQLDKDAEQIFDAALAAVCLPPASRFFTLTSAAEMTVSP